MIRAPVTVGADEALADAAGEAMAVTTGPVVA
jgi:hypothetical protein